MKTAGLLRQQTIPASLFLSWQERLASVYHIVPDDKMVWRVLFPSNSASRIGVGLCLQILMPLVLPALVGSTSCHKEENVLPVTSVKVMNGLLQAQQPWSLRPK